ncbi:MAG: methylamine utilization protein [Candidatus Didemnitutus sp.]|nr:methylamine utilization protein [Candidatus Didemnitutus sp.]
MIRLLLLSLCLLTLRATAATTVSAVIKDAKGAAVPDAVIALYALDGAVSSPAADQPLIEISQQDQEYTPYVTVIRVGTVIEFPNRDDIQHHIYSLSKAKRFEKPLYAPGAHESVLFDHPGIITLGCNIHDWMIAYIVVLPTPHFAKTDATGTAQLIAPSGRYRVEVWHPRLSAPQIQEVTFADGVGPLEYRLTLKPDRRIRRTLEGKTGGY